MMLHSEVATLLGYITRHTQRRFDADDVDAWHDAADYGRWTVEEAAAAVRRLVNEPAHASGPLRPVDVTAAIRAARQDASMRATTEHAVAWNRQVEAARAKAIEAGASRIGQHPSSGTAAGIYDAQGWSQTGALTSRWRCTACNAGPGERCTRASSRSTTGRAELAEPHGARVALIAPCPDPSCLAQIGEECLDRHPHPGRERDALGQAGAQRRRDTAARQLGRSPGAAPTFEPTAEQETV